MEKVSIKQPVLCLFFPNSRSLEWPGLIIETLEYLPKRAKTVRMMMTPLILSMSNYLWKTGCGTAISIFLHLWFNGHNQVITTYQISTKKAFYILYILGLSLYAIKMLPYALLLSYHQMYRVVRQWWRSRAGVFIYKPLWKNQTKSIKKIFKKPLKKKSSNSYSILNPNFNPYSILNPNFQS